MSAEPKPEPKEAAPEPARKQVTVRVRKPWEPEQALFVNSPCKNKIVKAGRRGGKTCGSATLAVEAFLGDPVNGIPQRRVLYAAPTIDQVEAFWAEVLRALHEPLQYQMFYKNETKHMVALSKLQFITDASQMGEPRIRAKTAFNAQTLRGDYADLLILDEYQLMDETAWEEVGAPMLIQNNGDVVFIFTPPSRLSRAAIKAKDPMHAAKMFRKYSALNPLTGEKLHPDWLCLHFASNKNPYLSAEGLEQARKRMSNLAYRQEILAEDNDEAPGALWKREWFETGRSENYNPLAPNLEFTRIVVGVDPAVTAEAGSDLTGIVVVGQMVDKQGYVLADLTSKEPVTPETWANSVVNAYRTYQADCVVAETNNGGDLVTTVLHTVDPNLPVRKVHASRGKATRAEPISVLYEQGLIHHCGELPELEDQLCNWLPGTKSPDRLDAAVWACYELFPQNMVLGLLELYKSGRMAQLVQMGVKPSAPAGFKRPAGVATPAANKVADSSNLAAIQTADETPRCPQCQGILLQDLPMQEKRCRACGHQWFPKGQPEIPRATFGGLKRHISLQK